jgi:mono/diheme cytochrome c family protein
MLKRLLISALSAASISASAWAEGAGDPMRGQAYSAAMCTTCHAVTRDEAPSPNPAAKPFRSVELAFATSEAFATWLNTQHPGLGGHMIKTNQAEDIAVYIGTLKAAPPK